jgi:hypothetical protein
MTKPTVEELLKDCDYLREMYPASGAIERVRIALRERLVGEQTLEKSIVTAREEALEEAAKICDGIHQEGSLDAFYLAIAIRALKPTTEAGGGENVK